MKANASKIANLFLMLVILQGCHSIEEYIGKLWENFPPATALTGLISDDLHFGFLVINIGLFIVGLLCWIFLVRTNHYLAKYAIAFWLFIELVNGVGHPVWSVIQKGYTLGVITAPFLFIVSILLLKTIYGDKVRSSKL